MSKSSQQSKVKQEKSAPQPDTGEYDDWAKKLLSKAVAPVGQQQNAGNLAPIFAGQTTVTDALPPNSGFDADSAIGKFYWITITEDKSVPCVYRNKDGFVCIRMAEESIIGERLNLLPPELYDSAKIVCYRVTPCEAKLLTYINTWHMDGFYGPDHFTVQQDLVISVKDLQTFHAFLEFAFSVLHSGGSNADPDFKRCGFVRVNGESLIPYTVLDCGGKGVPLFYFEGQTDILAAKAQPLSGWPLAYLKVCCKVQGVRKDLIANPTLQIVTLSDLQAYFPKRTTFDENCWPNAKPKSLLPKQILQSAMASPKVQISSDKWTKMEANESFPNFTTSVITNTTNSTTTTTTTAVLPKNGGVAHVMLNYNGVQTNMQIPRDVQTRSPALTKIKISTAPIDRSKLYQIPDCREGKQPNAYNVRLIVVEKHFMHCINSRPGSTISEDYLLVLQEYMERFLPTCSIYPTGVTLLHSKNIKTYLPNIDQMNALNKFGFQIQESWQIPLVSANEVSRATANLRAAIQPRPVMPANIVSNGGNNVNNSNYRTYGRR